jgi:hypothetical protein
VVEARRRYESAHLRSYIPRYEARASVGPSLQDPHGVPMSDFYETFRPIPLRAPVGLVSRLLFRLR